MAPNLMPDMKSITLTLFICLLFADAYSQVDSSAVRAKSLDSVTIISFLNQHIVKPLPPQQGTYLFSGKKSESIDLTQVPADIANKTGRQLYSKVPGIFVYDMDGAGNQLNIAARGLDPHRGWEFNIRKDGVLTNSDMYGYPASHYSMPLESIARIELVRGTGSLQYGAQFGGMLNYITKQADSTRPISLESINTVGSFKLMSTYNAIGGQLGRLRYYAYFQKKSRDGYRTNEHTDSEAEAVILAYQASASLNIRAEWARSKYLYRMPGPLTDSQFHADPTQATRSRNYFSPDIHVPSITINWQLGSNTRLQLLSSAVLGNRNSVQFDKPTNIHDTINAATQDYNNRQVDIDAFHSYTTELRLSQSYDLAGKKQVLVGGVQYMNNDLHRRQLGKGTTGSDYDIRLVEPGWGRDVHLKTRNLAFFVENSFSITSKFTFNAGARLEAGKTDMSGTIVYYPQNEIPLRIRHSFPLLGFSLSYKLSDQAEMYGGWSQSYHPMLFKDLIPSSLFEKVDPSIRDARGYNAELGFRGSRRYFRWDVNAFLLKYQDRFGTLSGMDDNGNFYTYRTNIGNSLTTGAEIFAQRDWIVGSRMGISLFTSTAIIHARYQKAIVKSGNENIDVRGNKVESAPDLITRNGVSVRYRGAALSLLYSYTSSTFADALNTVEPAKATGAVGLVPSYGLLDANFSFRFNHSLEARVNLNNALDRQYFTKRPSFYPGPGVWPSEGRNGSVTLMFRL